MQTVHKCIIGDSRKMDAVKDSSIHLVVTSPPYWQLKDYGGLDQIGFHNDYDAYINNLNLVWKECYRVLHPGCKMVVNIGDQFARSAYYGRYKVIPIRTEIIKFCETIGFDYMGAIIWQKKTTMNTTGGATIMGSYPHPRNGILEIDYEFILVFKKDGKGPKIPKEIKEQSKLSKEKWKEYFSGHWYFGGAKQDDHIAVFPLELPKRAIEMFTFIGETVLDPFLGSGTTSIAAMNAGRNSIGYEINDSFRHTIKSKWEKHKLTLFENKLHFEKQPADHFDWDREIKNLPYVFVDPIKLNRKKDPRIKKYGSKVSSDDARNGYKREEYFKVRKIKSPKEIELDNGENIILIGIKPIPSKKEEALEFLHTKIGKGHVSLKYDSNLPNENGEKFAYVYMKNKTFINAHLIKRGYAEVDLNRPFKREKEFKKLQKERES